MRAQRSAWALSLTSPSEERSRNASVLLAPGMDEAVVEVKPDLAAHRVPALAKAEVLAEPVRQLAGLRRQQVEEECPLRWFGSGVVAQLRVGLDHPIDHGALHHHEGETDSLHLHKLGDGVKGLRV